MTPLFPSSSEHLFIPAGDYDLGATLESGQAFRWRRRADSWEGVVGARWVRLNQTASGIRAETAEPPGSWDWLADYLQIGLDLGSVLQTFPADDPMRASLGSCRGLRLLRQEPWECLASFILSSTKQIVQIQEIIRLLCARYGTPVAGPAGAELWHAFPSAARLAAATEDGLRACKMGFRAPNLLATARQISAGKMDLDNLRLIPEEEARMRLMELPGVGSKIACCVLLFAYGFPRAFPVDVWVMRALRELYFPRRRPTPARLRRFIAEYFGPHAGYAQQYLFHYMRKRRPVPSPPTGSAQQPVKETSVSPPGRRGAKETPP